MLSQGNDKPKKNPYVFNLKSVNMNTADGKANCILDMWIETLVDVFN